MRRAVIVARNQGDRGLNSHIVLFIYFYMRHAVIDHVSSNGVLRKKSVTKTGLIGLRAI